MSENQRRVLARIGVPGVADVSFTKRLRAMLPTAPVHRLSAITNRQEWAGAAYDARALSIAAIDAVIARQGLGVGLEYDDLVLDIAQLARLAADDRVEDESLDVARYIVDGLLNNRDGNTGQAFRYSYSDYRDGHVTREIAFYLLVERSRADGRIVLEASVEAVNALRGGLDMNVEDAQTAMRFILDVQIREGRLEDAEISAEMNQRLSYEQATQLRELLDVTRADIARVDWAGDVLARLKRARDHVGRCIDADSRLLAHLEQEDVRDQATAATTERIVNLLEAALTQHRSLHGQLMSAPEVFLEEQRRQELNRRGRPVWSTSVRDGILVPFAGLGMAEALPIAERFLTDTLGITPPRLPHLGRLLDRLLERRLARDEPEVDLDDVDLDDIADEPDPFPPAVTTAARRVIAACRETPRRLSSMLDDAEADGPLVAELVRLSVLWCYGAEGDDEPTIAAELIDDDLVALFDGTRFANERWTGDDLLVGTIAAFITSNNDEIANDFSTQTGTLA